MEKIVVLDAGHGLPDMGACGQGLQEYKVAFELVQMISKHLISKGVKVILTRTSDKSLSSNSNLKANKNEDLGKRVKIANSSGADLLVSIHLNASNGKGHGYETLCHSNDAKVQTIHNEIVSYLKQFGRKDRGIKLSTQSQHGGVAILDKTVPKAVLMECLFIDNVDDMSYMKQQSFKEGLALAIANGVLKALGLPAIQQKGSDEYMIKVQDANAIIKYLQAAWQTATCEDEKKKIGYLADEVRKASGQKAVNG